MTNMMLVDKRFLTGNLKGLTIRDTVPVGYPVGKCIRTVEGSLCIVRRTYTAEYLRASETDSD